MVFRRKLLLAAAIAAMAAVVAPATASASFSVTLSSGVSNVTYTDNVDPQDINANVNAIQFGDGDAGTFLSFAGYRIQVKTNVFNRDPVIGPQLRTDTNFVVQNIFGANPLTITINAVGILNLPGTTPPDEELLTTGATVNGFAGIPIGPTTGGKIEVSSTADPLSATTPTITLKDWADPAPANSGNAYAAYLRTDVNYNLSQKIVTTLAAGESVDFKVTTTVAVPAPPGLILAATALPFFGILRRRLRGAAATV